MIFNTFYQEFYLVSFCIHFSHVSSSSLLNLPGLTFDMHIIVNLVLLLYCNPSYSLTFTLFST